MMESGGGRGYSGGWSGTAKCKEHTNPTMTLRRHRCAVLARLAWFAVHALR
jgi:hypothetical protein